MESQDKEKEYERNIWEIYHKEWATASGEKRIELNNRMRRWQELMKNGWTAQQAYYKAMEGELDFRVAEEPSGKQLAIPSAPRLRKAPFVILGLALVAAIVYGVVITGDRDALNTELTTTKQTLASTQAELGSTKETLASTQVELTTAKQTLASKQEELAATHEELAVTREELGRTKGTLLSKQYELEDMQTELASTQSELGSTKETLASTQSDLASTQQQLAVAQETLGGLGITLSTSKECYDVALIDNPTATNPTWNQLMTFLSQDQTEKHTYIKDEYDCSQFSRDVHNNAEAAGIRAAEVQIEFRYESVGHALNAFLTTDYGLVYVDCTGAPDTRVPDTIARVKAGKEYRAVGLNRITKTNIRNDYWWDTLSLYYIIPSSWGWGNKVTSSIKIYW